MKKNSFNVLKRGVLFVVCFTMLLLVFTAVPGQAKQATISLSMPELVKGNTVYASINIENVENLDTGQFDLIFNPDVLKVAGVENGNIEKTEIPIKWSSLDSKSARVIFNLEGVSGVSGSGKLASIGFEVIGEGEGGLYISNGLLGDTEAKSINTDWGSTKAGNADMKDAKSEDAQKASSGFVAGLTVIGLSVAMYLTRNKQR